jgi:hypothetical protein
MKKRLFKTQLLVLHMIITCIAANAQELEWVQSMGGTGNDESRSLATDKDGNVYITGTFNNTADFNNRRGIDTFKSYGGTDIYLAKYDAAGNYLWAIQMGGTGFDYGRGVTVDSGGNVYVTGYFNGKAAFNPAGGDTLQGGAGFTDIFIAKYSSTGDYKWAINMGGSMQNYGWGIAVNESGEVYITGAFSGKTDFDPSPAPADTAYIEAFPGNFFSPGLDIFVAKYDSAGRYMWANRMGSEGPGGEYGYGIALDKSGNAYVTGYFANWADFDPGTGIAILETRGTIGNDAFVAKYDKDGKYLWAKGIGSKHDDNGMSIAMDQGDNVYVTGYFSDTAYLYDTTSTPGAAMKSDSVISAGDYDMFLVKYDSAGNYLWSKTLGGKSDEGGYGISIGRGGMVCVTGYFADTAIFGGADTLRAVSGSRDAFIAKFNPDGHYKWAGSLGGSTQSDMGYGISCDQLGNIYAAGNYAGAADLEPGPGTANFMTRGSTDIYLLKLACSDTSSSALQQQGCGSFTFNGQTYTAAGTYKQILTNSAGCDSTITLYLEISNPEAIISVNGFMLSTTMRFVTYQWIKDGTAIDGATDSTYLVTENARYQVAVTNEHGCPDTSAFYTVTNVGIDDKNGIAAQIKIYPNPAGNDIYITSPVAVNAVLTTLEGKHVMRADDVQSLSLRGLSGGVYFLRILDKENKLIKTDKIIKE